MKILVVEDDPTSRKVLTAILAKDGHHVVTAENGLEARAVFDREQPELIMMDVMMPVMDGYEAARLIKQRCGSRFIPIIFLTALTDDAALAQCVESGGDDFLPKPYNRVLIRAKIEAMDRIRSLYRATASQRDALAQYQLTTEEEMRLAGHVFNRATAGSPSHGGHIRYLGWAVGRWSGDVLIHAQTPSGRIHILLGDFTGHGLAAAVGTLPATDVFRAMTERDCPIDEIAAVISTKLQASLPVGYFCAAALVSLDRNTGEAVVWNGGLPPVLVLDGAGRVTSSLPSTHLPLGIAGGDRANGDLHRVMLEPGGSLLMVSDGLVEAQDPSGLRFEMRRLEEGINAAESASSVFETVRERVIAFTAGRQPHDDLSLVQVGLLPGDGSHPTRVLKVFVTNRSIDLNLPACALKTTDPLILFSAWPGTQSLGDAHRSRLHTVIAELVNNAVEHGLLGLDPALRATADGFHEYYRLREEGLKTLREGFLKVSVEREAMPGGLLMRIRVEDSGPGFDVSRVLASSQSLQSYRGRGVSLVRTLGAKLRYLGCGNTVEAEYCKPLDSTPTDLAA